MTVVYKNEFFPYEITRDCGTASEQSVIESLGLNDPDILYYEFKY